MAADRWRDADSLPPPDSFGAPACPPPGPCRDVVPRGERPVVALVSLYVRENSGLRLLASLLRDRGVEVHEIYFKDWVNNRVEPPRGCEVRLLLDELRRCRAHLVGISVRASAFHGLATRLTERIRTELGLPVLWGGMHPTSCPEEASRVADLICVGEAEQTMVALAEQLKRGDDPRPLPGLWLHTDDGLVRTGVAPLTADLDSLPPPDFHSPNKVFIEDARLTRGDPYVAEPIYLVMASRGCPFPSCTFCSNSMTDQLYPDQRTYRVRSPDHLFEEVRYARRTFPRLRRFRFDDEEFPVQRRWFDEFCRRWPTEGALPFEVHMDPRVITAERLRRLQAVGLDMVFMGIQSTEEVNRSLYCRDVSDEQVLAAAHIVHAAGLRAGYQVILDDPVSTAEDKRRLFHLLLSLPRPFELVLFSLTVYPHTALAKMLVERGLIAPDQVEGPATKVFRQFRVDLSYPRAPEDQFWSALAVLVSKDFVPRPFLRRLARSRRLRRDPRPLTALAYLANVAKLAQMGLELLVRKELSWAVAKRWLDPQRLVTF